MFPRTSVDLREMSVSSLGEYDHSRDSQPVLASACDGYDWGFDSTASSPQDLCYGFHLPLPSISYDMGFAPWTQYPLSSGM